MQLSDYTNRTSAEILRDLNVAWDRIKTLQKDGDTKQAAINALTASLQREKLKRWITTGALVTLWEVFKLFVLHR